MVPGQHHSVLGPAPVRCHLEVNAAMEQHCEQTFRVKVGVLGTGDTALEGGYISCQAETVLRSPTSGSALLLRGRRQMSSFPKETSSGFPSATGYNSHHFRTVVLNKL